MTDITVAGMVESLGRAKQEFITAKARNSGVAVAKERMKNLLFNYYDPIVQALLENAKLKEENDMLEASLEDTDKENDELRAKIKELEEQPVSPKKSKSRAPSTLDGE